MTGRFARFLVPVDGSEASLRAVDFAAALAAECGATLDVVCALELPTPAGITDASLAEEALAEVREEVERRVLVPAAARVTATRAGCQTRLLIGPVAEMLLEAAGAPGISMVVMGRTGHGPFKRLVEGSVFKSLAAHCPVPITIVG